MEEVWALIPGTRRTRLVEALKGYRNMRRVWLRRGGVAGVEDGSMRDGKRGLVEGKTVRGMALERGSQFGMLPLTQRSKLTVTFELLFLVTP